MAASAPLAQRFLEPSVLARIADLPLVAKTVVQGFLTGLHRSPYQGVSIDFAEYRPYSPGDDPRGVDWNVYARMDRHYIKKYHGETNAELHIVLDSSASMGYAGKSRPDGRWKGQSESRPLSKFEYGCYLAASLAFFAARQRDAIGLLLFDTEIVQSLPARARPGQLGRLLYTLDQARPGRRTDFSKPLEDVARFLRRRGMVVLISDFYDEPERVMRPIRALASLGNDVIVFHLLDPEEMELALETPTLLEDVETGERVEVIPEYAGTQYRHLIEQHISKLRHECRSAYIDYELLNTGRPLDYALFAYLAARQRRM